MKREHRDMVGLLVGAILLVVAFLVAINTSASEIRASEAEIDSLKAIADSMRMELNWWHRYVAPDTTLLQHEQMSQGISQAEARSNTQWLIAYGLHVGVPPRLLLSVGHIESRYRAGVESPAGALGFMQVMPRLWWNSFRRACGYWRRGDNRANICYGAHVLRYYVNRCDGNYRCALSRYNSGYAETQSSQGREYARAVLARWEAL